MHTLRAGERKEEVMTEIWQIIYTIIDNHRTKFEDGSENIKQKHFKLLAKTIEAYVIKAMIEELENPDLTNDDGDICMHCVDERIEELKEKLDALRH